MSPRNSIKAAFVDGWEADTGVAYHGTSLAALEEIIKTGKINGSTYSQVEKKIDMCVRERDLFVFPIQGKIQPGFTIEPYFTDKKAFEKAAGYASDISYHHFFMKLCEYPLMTADSLTKGDWKDFNFLDFSSHFQPSLPRSEQDEELVIPFYDFLRSKGHGHKKLQNYIERRIQRKVLFSLFQKISFLCIISLFLAMTGMILEYWMLLLKI